MGRYKYRLIADYEEEDGSKSYGLQVAESDERQELLKLKRKMVEDRSCYYVNFSLEEDEHYDR